MSTTLGQYNPLRYRGYVYDLETQLYYLQSRYYNPSWGRFINADDVYDLDGGIQGYNVFLYCANNPINRIDSSGADSEKVDDADLTDDELCERGGAGDGFSGGRKRTSFFSSKKTTTTQTNKPPILHTKGVGSPKNNVNPGGSYTKVDNNGNLYSYTQFDDSGRQTMRMDFQGRPHGGVLPHIHLYVYPQQGGRMEYIFDLNWHLLN